MGLTFKENCPDLRNTRVVHIVAYQHYSNSDVYFSVTLARSA
jgi:UDP-N-acetyl-D-mannosaminuronate dehydrogenase